MAKHMSKVDLGRALARAANDVAEGGLLRKLQEAASEAGCSYEMVDEICLFMDDGDVRVGVPKDSPAAQEAFDLEWGTAVGAPRGWLRSSVAVSKRDFTNLYSAALNHRLLGL